MRSWLIALLLPALGASAQSKTYTPAELKRLESLGRLWGAVHYFHPAMGSGRIVTDSLVVRNAESLAQDPSAANFRHVTSNLLAQLGDPATRLAGTQTRIAPVLLQSGPGLRRFPDGTWYVSLPTASAASARLLENPELNPMIWDSARALVIDLRNEVLEPLAAEMADEEFKYSVLPFLRARIAGNTALPELYSRRVYHQGFVNQSDGTGNIYASGWRTLTRGKAAASPELAGIPALRAPVAIVVNAQNSRSLIEALLQLQAAGRCQIVYEGDAFVAGELLPVPLADGLQAQVRVTDDFMGNDPVPPPAWTIARIESFDESGAFFNGLRSLLLRPAQAATATNAQQLSQRYDLPRPGAYPETMKDGPSVGLRLLGLYNFWNAIRYFNPYKNLLPQDWDGELARLLPPFLAARNGYQYQRAVQLAVSKLHDSHGFIRNTNGRTPARDSIGYWAPLMTAFVGDKLYVVDVGTDSTQDMSVVKLWDEVIALDGVPLRQAVERFRSMLPTSNESTFHRDLPFTLLNGPLRSSQVLLLRRNGKDISVRLTRSGRDEGPNRKRVEFNDDHSLMKILPSNIGYVNMGALDRAQVDSMFRVLQHTKAIIFDVRNYPRGTAWSIAPRLAMRDTVAVRFEMPLVDYNYFTGNEEQLSTTSYFTVHPDTTKPRYGGKVVLLCNQSTQSQAEYSIMMMQAAARATTIGSQTAGADGNVTDIVWPGGYRSSFSGTAILYPDGKQTQRSGIRVDIPAAPTLEGLKAGKDEVLERAIRFVNTGK